MEPLLRRLAREAYCRYTATTDNKNYQGLPCPAFDDLNNTIKSAWEAAVKPLLEAEVLRKAANDAMFLLKDQQNGDYINDTENLKLAKALCAALGLDWEVVKDR